MLIVDEVLREEWPRERYQGLLFDVPLTEQARTHLFEVLHQGLGWEDMDEPAQLTEPVATPDGFAVRVEDGSPRFFLAVVELLERRGLTGSVRAYDPFSPNVFESLLTGPWCALWLRPSREADCPGATAAWIEAVRRHLERRQSDDGYHVQTRQREFRVEVGDVSSWVQRWRLEQVDVALWPDDAAVPGPIAVVRPVKDDTLVGLAYGPFNATLDAAVATFAQFRVVLEEMAGVIDYGVAAVHRYPLGAAIGDPFSDPERRPETDVVRFRRLDVLDQVVLDAAPIQVLGPGHNLEDDKRLSVMGLERGRRLVSIGQLRDWLDSPEAESAAITAGRQAFSSLLPSHEGLVRLHARRQPPG